MKLKFVDDVNRVWTYGTAQVQYLAFALGLLWASMPEEMRTSVMAALGLSPMGMLIASVALHALATYAARSVEIVKPKTSEEGE